MNKKLIVFLAFLLLGNLLCFAQNDIENVKPKEIALEISFLKQNPPSYLNVPEEEAKTNWVWFSGFGRVLNWQPPADALPVRAVKFVVWREKNAVKTKISVYTGQKQFEREEIIDELTLGVNDKKTINGLKKFGVEPFEIELVKVVPSVAALPKVDNKSNSVTVAGLKPNYSTLPSYTLTLTNNSSKAVSAFTFEVSVGGERKLSGMPQGKEGENLIEPGGIYKQTFNNVLIPGKISEGQIFPVQSDEIFTITSVIFNDGTFEGDQLKAADFLAFNLGRKLQTSGIVRLLSEIGWKNFDLSNLEKRAENLGTTVDDENYQILLGKVPNLPDDLKLRLRKTVEFTLQSVKNDFIREIRAEIKSASDAKSNRNWITENLQRYENWLARLNENR